MFLPQDNVNGNCLTHGIISLAKIHGGLLAPSRRHRPLYNYKYYYDATYMYTGHCYRPNALCAHHC